jgi:hypothetical protein
MRIGVHKALSAEIDTDDDVQQLTLWLMLTGEADVRREKQALNETVTSWLFV